MGKFVGAAGPEADGTIQEPFRILPTREVDPTPAITALLFGAAIIAAGVRYGAGLSGQLICGLAGLVVIGLGAFLYRWERRRFGPNGRYYMAIGRSALRIVDPDGASNWPWGDLSSFTVTEWIVPDSNHSPRHRDPHFFTKRGYRLSAHSMRSGEELVIDLDTFAGELGTPGRERAEIMCRIMNDLRRRNASTKSREAAAGSIQEPYPVPRGLRVSRGNPELRD